MIQIYPWAEVRTLRFSKTSLHVSLLLAISAFVSIITVPSSPKRLANPVPVFESNGKPLTGLFDDSPAYAKFEERNLRRPLFNTCNLSPLSSTGEFILSLISGTTVHAQSCSFSTCGSHYMSDAYPFCGGGSCSYDNYSKYYSLPEMGAAYCDGYRFTGYNECQGCSCDELGCNSCEL